MEEIESKNRAWIEINLKNLENNIKEIKSIISKNSKIMAVVKADAYGHGDILIAKRLFKIGIKDFAVATLEEGIRLRENNINGNILILGFTEFKNLNKVIKYNLIQTIIDYEYSKNIKGINLKEKLKCHIKINTGMNRIGEKYDNMEKLFKIYDNEKLDILGTFSHLSSADSKDNLDIEFTKIQIKCFEECIKRLKENGYNVGDIHLQSSYGAVNYPNLYYDYVRIGILMYGINSSLDSYCLKKLKLKPVLELKARITSIREICKNESVGYGRSYIAKEKRKIAAVSIGYADGVPRNLAHKEALVKVNKDYAPIIGKICMDQLTVDITNISNVNQGDIVTLIGNDNNISAERVAQKTGTITNELLSRLGNRLKKVQV